MSEHFPDGGVNALNKCHQKDQNQQNNIKQELLEWMFKVSMDF